ncbi:small ribosomal subunit biogenesis GTPase RsgA [Hydrocarboniclastica marina]|uniref:Small ribosomal subunit biogenesis GTPase RsgA n=1 Tax=Hydrocarboniclastica marina TaxID=2259620 RepID=A0A4P7XIQ1_9ALTE|nr:small ribosomal subunit biogenesis GTPase RsgA [Hydrocarboniclastica marina]QCF26625.1 small ribosomal subunit biogenesis GTPase RsgA [Hydrocarboniclastica marina]
MAKRRLNKQQHWRIQKVQEERAKRADRKERQIDQELSAGTLGDEQQGLVIAHYGQQLEVEALEGEQRGQLIRCHARANLASLVTGDTVVWRPGAEGTGVIVARHDRRTELLRPDNYGQLKPVAANIDQILLVIAPEPEPHANLIDRYLVAAEVTGIPPVLLLNKADLAEAKSASIVGLLQGYEQLGYQVLRTSARQPEELVAQLGPWLKDRTSVFVGQSGVGKSSLIQQLMPGEDIRVGALSEGQRKGTHTTTTARLFHLPAGGRLVDSPGIREFGLWHITEDQLIDGFIDISPLVGHCRFRNCRHQGEPGCALDAAVKAGKLTSKRRASFERILSDMESQQSRGLSPRTD